MPLMRPDPTFYPSPGMAMKAPPERLAYVVLLNVGKNGKRDAMGTIDLEPSSAEYGRLVGQADFPAATMSFTISAGTLAAHACALRPRIRTWNVAT